MDQQPATTQARLAGRFLLSLLLGALFGIPLPFSGYSFFLLLLALLMLAATRAGMRNLPIRALLYTWVFGIGLATGTTATMHLWTPGSHGWGDLASMYFLILAVSGFAGTFASFASLVRLGLFTSPDKSRAEIQSN